MPLLVLIVFIIAFIVFCSTSKERKYNKTEYAKVTGLKYKDVMSDVGRSGEYLTYEELTRVPGYKRFLFNCLLPAKDGNTTEIDILMIHASGIYVFECKNYKGWIFGNESQRIWTQALSNGKGKKAQKEHFYNPMMQNASHIRWLEKYLNGLYPGKIYSYIIFGDKCSFKSVTQTEHQHSLAHVGELSRMIGYDVKARGSVFSNEFIDKIYDKLYPLSQKTEQERAEHVSQVKNIQKMQRNNAEIKERKPVLNQTAPLNTAAAHNAPPWAAYSKPDQPKEETKTEYCTAATGIPPWRKE